MGNPYYVKFGRTKEITNSKQTDSSKNDQNIAPVVRTMAFIRILSHGPDGQIKTNDDFDVSTFTKAISELSGEGMQNPPFQF